MTYPFPRAGALALLTLLAVACAKPEDLTPVAPAGHYHNLAMGNPSGAMASPSGPTNYLLVKHQYTLSYNRD